MTVAAWAFDVARDLLADALPRRWAHVRGVAERSRTAGKLVDDADLLAAAALLHDIGYSPGLVETGFHPVDGARHLRRVGAPDRLVGLVAHHSCAVVEADLRGLSADLAVFADEGPTIMRDALWWADMTTTPDGERTTISDRVVEIQRRYGPDDVVSRFIRAAEPGLRAAVERTERRLAGHE